jgi:hypothetical protein
MFSGNKIWRAKHKSFVLLGRFLTDLAPSRAGLFFVQVGWIGEDLLALALL